MPPRILLVRLRLIGDVVFTTPLIRALRGRYPGSHLAYLVEPPAAPVVEANAHLDEVVVAAPPDAPGRLASDLALARRLRCARFDIVLDLHGGPRAALLSWASRAPRRIGYAIPGRSWAYTDRVARSRDLMPRHSVANQWDLLAPLGFDPPDPETDATEMPATAEAGRSAVEKLARAGVDLGREPLVVMHVSAGNPFRRWPADSFVELAVSLVRGDPRRRVLLLSGPSERDAAAEIGSRARAALGEARAAAGVLDGVELDLRELRAVVERAALFIGGDSGPLHVAGTSPVPIVGLYGPTLPQRSAPWRPARFITESVETRLACRPCDQRRCEHGDFRCLARLETAAVLSAAERALEASSPGATKGSYVR